MKKILFYTENKWAFGSIHHGLCKELYKHNIYANVLDWSIEYTKEEFKLLSDKYDLIVTVPPFVLKLHRIYDIPLHKISAFAHGQWDILLAKSEADFDFYPHIHSFGVISDILLKKCQEWNFVRLPSVVEFGIHFDLFYSEPSNCLKTFGGAGAYKSYNFFGDEIKRGYLLDLVAQNTRAEFIKHKFYHFMAMPSFYKSIDCVVQPSSEEAGGLPMMECAAAGRLPIGTPVGYFEHNADKGGGILAPMNEFDFVQFVSETINYYHDNPEIYLQKCLEVQQYAKDNYDWNSKINSWIDFLQ